MWGKRLELLKEAIPATAKVAFLGMRDGWERAFGQTLRDISGQLGVSLISIIPNTGTTAEIERVFAEMAQVHAQWFADYESLYRPRTAQAIREGQTVGLEELAAARDGRIGQAALAAA